MKTCLAIALVCAPSIAVTQSPDELDIFAAMIEGPEGTPLATATAVSGDQDEFIYITKADVSDVDGACVRIWVRGPCHPVSRTEPITGYDALAFAIIPAQHEDQIAKFSQMQMTRQPLVGAYDPVSGDGLTFVTQNGFSGWERPISQAEPSGVSGGLAIMKNAAFTEFSVGAPLMHPRDGLVGLVAQVNDGFATMLPVREALLETEAAGYPVQDWMLPPVADDVALPARVAGEIGRIIIFHDYSDIGFIGGFYGPSQGTGFDETFNTRINYSVWEIDLSDPSGQLIAQDDRAVPLVPAGMAIEAPFTGTPGDYMASCITHATPSSEGRLVYVVQFWRNAPARFDPNVGSKDYDQAAKPMVGWASEDTCSFAIANMGAERLATLSDGTVIALETQPGIGIDEQINENVGTDADDEGLLDNPVWLRISTWVATGREALYRDLPDGRQLTVGCTSSKELIVSVSPGATLSTINGVTAKDGPNGERYAFLPKDLPEMLSLEGGGLSLNIPMTQDLSSCSPT